MINVLGLDIPIFSQVSVLEKSAYRVASTAFLVVVGMSLIANGFLGMMLYGSWISALVFMLFFSFIQFSILRIALITLLSKPLASATDVTSTVNAAPSAPAKKVLLNSLKKTAELFELSKMFRILFVGLMAITISFPFASLLMFPKVAEIEKNHRIELIQSNVESTLIQAEIQNTHFPFHVFKQLLSESSFNALLVFSIFTVFVPLILVTRLRNNSKYEYLEKLRQEMLKLVAIDYNETMEQCQFQLDKNFPLNQIDLNNQSVYADAPINSIFKNPGKRTIGNKTGFNQFIQSVK